ncbi:hypothetical protein PAMC26510_09520 [Caballeronia sordidicola]|uniref:Uncharacterized protein n=1 Tax=Caballeronia sordidicola TaxID=196367 RepID=A0A242N1G7_CABSO|nr:hypothetical protein PAMC26510_09520 [Caballeronia sordidicola]
MPRCAEAGLHIGLIPAYILTCYLKGFNVYVAKYRIRFICH